MTARNEPAAVRARVAQGLVAVVALGFLAAKFRVLGAINVNWDEFMFLSRVHELARGDLATSFQTFHVHLFGWLGGVRGTEVDQVVAARTVAFVLRVASCVLVFLLARRVASPSAALVATLATLTFSYLARHGESFRADPLIAFLFLVAATLLAWRLERVMACVIAGVAFALAANISVTAAIYVPAIGCVVAVLAFEVGGAQRRRRLVGAAVFGAAAILSYAALHLFHAAATSSAGTQVVESAIASGGGMLGGVQVDALRRSLRADWLFWLLCAAGMVTAGVDLARRATPVADRHRATLLLALLLPLASLGLYRNTWPYFYVTIVPLAALGVAYAVARAERMVGHAARPLVALVPAAVLAVQGARFIGAVDGDETAPQRAVLEAVHEVFPEPVAYLDRCGMVSTFPAANIFMSTYVTAAYRRRGEPQMALRVARRQPRFLLANVETLALDVGWPAASASPRRLLREDFEFLKDNFVHHWGPVWVVGKRVPLAGHATPVEIVVAGPYTVESAGPVMIDSVRRAPGEVVELAAGSHTVSGTGELVLRWGSRLRRPSASPPSGQLFRAL